MRSSQVGYLDVDGMTVRYQVGGQGAPVLLLHGWGGTMESFAPVYNELRRSYTAYAFDLPGFGHSSLPQVAWGAAEYARLTVKLMDHLKLDQPHLIGHSFGGQVAIALAATYPGRVGNLVLVGSAGVHTRRPLGVHLKRLVARVGKWLAAHAGWIGRQLRDAIYRCVQSQDYATAGPLRATLVKVINEDLKGLLPQITVPTLLVWGEHDTEVPLAAARVMARLIPDVRLVILEQAGHFPYLDQFGQFRLIVNRFLRGEAVRTEFTKR